MQTNLADFIKNTAAGQEADAILRKCTHCGFCLANCPTYRILGDELDSPRGRIYQIKQVLEGEPATESIQLHLDRCLTCRACETTCPSGVEYGRLADLGREIVEQQVPRAPTQRWLRLALRSVLPRPQLFAGLMTLGRFARPLVPNPLRKKIRQKRAAPAWPASQQHGRFVLMLEGCVQPTLEPPINPQTARILDALGIGVQRTTEVTCCGAIDQHLGAPEKAADRIRRNIDAWWPLVEQGAEAIIVNASGCGAQVKDYGHLLEKDADYAQKARKISDLTLDPIELLENNADQLAPAADAPKRIAFQTPCTLQHAQKLNGRVDALLSRIGFELTPVPNSHICCGSAGTYSVLQPTLATELRDQKLASLNSGSPELIATANIGCLTHLDEASDIPVKHWLELIRVKPQA